MTVVKLIRGGNKINGNQNHRVLHDSKIQFNKK